MTNTRTSLDTATTHLAEAQEQAMTLREAVRVVNAHRESSAVARSLSDQLAREAARPSQDYDALAERVISYAEYLEA